MGDGKFARIIDRYGFFLSTMACILIASIRPNLGGAKGIINGNSVIWRFAIPLTYLEAGLCCSTTKLFSALRSGYLLTFLLVFMYVVMPVSARLVSFLLTYADVNVWLLKGMEVLYCMPPPFNTSLVLSRLTRADLPTSVVATLVCHFSGLFLSPILVYFMLGTSTPPLVGINVREIVYGTLLPLGIGVGLHDSLLPVLGYEFGDRTSWISQALLLLTTYHVFCDAISTDASAVGPVDILLCVFIACLTQMFLTYLCWILCSRWLPRNVLLSTVFTSTHKSAAIGGWLLRGAYHGLGHGPMVNLPLVILPMAQLLLGSLVASWLAPRKEIKSSRSDEK